jgi:hypothetical protein
MRGRQRSHRRLSLRKRVISVGWEHIGVRGKPHSWSGLTVCFAGLADAGLACSMHDYAPYA